MFYRHGLVVDDAVMISLLLLFRLEDGTLPFLGILALRHGFDMLTRLGRSMEDIQLHTFQLARSGYNFGRESKLPYLYIVLVAFLTCY